MVKYTLAFIFSFASFFIYSQISKPTGIDGTDKFCDVEIEKAKLLSERPELGELEKIAQQKLEDEFLQKKQAYKSGRVSNQTYVLPIVFHIVHGGGPENISDEQVEDAVRVLNEDFQLLNADTADVHPEFKNHIGNTNIEFRLARLDPSGNPTNGINRYYEPFLTVGAGEQSKVGGWDRAKYVNIWVVRNIGSGAAGYTYIPAWADGYPEGDGIIVLHDYVGRIGTGAVRRSRTLTHEVGHWINLFHTWGQTNQPGVASNCNDDDFVDDTPNTRGNGNCVNRVNTCPSIDAFYGKDQIDNLENYMEYTFCYNMFTKEQALRMRAATESSIAERNNLWSTQNLKETGVYDLTDADFSIGTGIYCWGESVVFFDQSKYGANNWSWNFPEANITSSTAKNPLLKFVKPGIRNVDLTASNGSVTVSKTKRIWALPDIGETAPALFGFENSSIFNKNVYVPIVNTDSVSFKLSSTFYSGSKSLRLRNFVADTNTIDEVIIGSIDVSPYKDFYVSWRYAFTQKDSTNNDQLSVYTSGDCGQTWTRKYQTSGTDLATSNPTTNEFVPSNTSQWGIAAISSFTAVENNSENLLIKFEFKGDGGNNFFIDEVNISGQYKDEPVLSYPRNGSENVSAYPLLDWKAVAGADIYQYQIDISPDFSSKWLKNGTTTAIDLDSDNEDTEAQLLALNNNTKYYWRVRAIRKGQLSSWSEVWDFTVSPNGLSTIDILEDEEVKVYPNPAKGFVNISLNNSDQNLEINLMDITGKMVFTKISNKDLVTLNIQNLSQGVYFIELISKDFRRVEKLIIE